MFVNKVSVSMVILCHRSECFSAGDVTHLVALGHTDRFVSVPHRLYHSDFHKYLLCQGNKGILGQRGLDSATTGLVWYDVSV